MAMLMVCFLSNIAKHNLLAKGKRVVLVMHLSFILILLGAFITRYFGDEGVMPIRENTISNTYLSEKTYLTVLVDGEKEGEPLRKTLNKRLLLSEYTNNNFEIADNFNKEKFLIKYKDFRENVSEGLVLDPEGEIYIKLIDAADGNRHEHYIKEGEVSSIHNILFTLNYQVKGAINISSIKGEYFINSPFEGEYTVMSTQNQGKLTNNLTQILELRSLYQIPGFQFVFPEPPLRGVFDIVDVLESDGAQQDVLIVDIEYKV